MICALYIQHDLSQECCSPRSIFLHYSFLDPHRSKGVHIVASKYCTLTSRGVPLFFISFVEIALHSAHVDSETYNYFISISVSCSRLQQVVEGEIEA